LSLLAGDNGAIAHAAAFNYNVLRTNAEMGKTMFDELDDCSNEQSGLITTILIAGSRETQDDLTGVTVPP
jgi:hypothetical protein